MTQDPIINYIGSISSVTEPEINTNNSSKINKLLFKIFNPSIEVERFDVKDINDSKTFFERFINTRKPCILTGESYSAIKSLDGLFTEHGEYLTEKEHDQEDNLKKGFTIDNILEHSGSTYIQIEKKKNGQYGSDSRIKMKLSDFIDELKSGSTNLYLTTQYNFNIENDDEDENDIFIEDMCDSEAKKRFIQLKDDIIEDDNEDEDIIFDENGEIHDDFEMLSQDDKDDFQIMEDEEEDNDEEGENVFNVNGSIHDDFNESEEEDIIFDQDNVIHDDFDEIINENEFDENEDMLKVVDCYTDEIDFDFKVFNKKSSDFVNSPSFKLLLDMIVSENEDIKEYAQPPLYRFINRFPLHPWIMKNLSPQQVNLWIGAVDIDNSVSTILKETPLFKTVEVFNKNNISESIKSWLMQGCGISSGLHHDFADNTYVLLHGRKRFTIFPPSDAESLYLYGKINKIYHNGMITYVNDDDDCFRSDGANLKFTKEFFLAESVSVENIDAKCFDLEMSFIYKDRRVLVSGRNAFKTLKDKQSEPIYKKCSDKLKEIWSLIRSEFETDTRVSKKSLKHRDWLESVNDDNVLTEKWIDISSIVIEESIKPYILFPYNDSKTTVSSNGPSFIDIAIEKPLQTPKEWNISAENLEKSSIASYLISLLDKCLENKDADKILKNQGKENEKQKFTPPSFSLLPPELLQLDLRKSLVRYLLRSKHVRLPKYSLEMLPSSIVESIKELIQLDYDTRLEVDRILAKDSSSSNDMMKLFMMLSERIPFYTGSVFNITNSNNTCNGCRSCSICLQMLGNPIFNKQSAHLNEGEVLYLPTGWFHEVTSFGKGTYLNEFSKSMFNIEESYEDIMQPRKKMQKPNEKFDKDTLIDPNWRKKLHMAFNYWMQPPSNSRFENPYIDSYWKDTFNSQVTKPLVKKLTEK